MLHELEQTIEVSDADVIVSGTPIDLARVVTTHHPIRRVGYELEEIGRPTLADVLAPLLRLVRGSGRLAEQWP
jgi:predicted GTPase